MSLFSANSPVIQLTPSNFTSKNTVSHPALSGKKGMIMFEAPWCGYCKQLAPIYEKTANTLGTSFPLFYVDCDKNKAIANKFNINSFPTVMYIDRTGAVYKKYTGNRTTQDLLNGACSEGQVCGRT